jgi:hypothetical protein
MVGIGSMWLRIGTGGELMWTRWWTSWFRKILGSSRAAAQLAASQEGLSSMNEWVSEWVDLNFRFSTQITALFLRFLNSSCNRRRMADTYCISSAEVHTAHTRGAGYKAIKSKHKILRENVVLFQFISALKIITHVQSYPKIVEEYT